MGLNEWFCSLPEAEQAMLEDDKWMLASRAWEAALTTKTEPVAKLHCSDGLDAPYELARLVEACRQLITAAGYDAGNVPKARAPWKVLCNAINYYGDKGI